MKKIDYKGLHYIGEEHSASSQEGNFLGSENFKNTKGKVFRKKFKLVCPNCKAEGNQLEHKNWFESKEYDHSLIIQCKKCEETVDTEEPDFRKWKQYTGEYE